MATFKKFIAVIVTIIALIGAAISKNPILIVLFLLSLYGTILFIIFNLNIFGIPITFRTKILLTILSFFIVTFLGLKLWPEGLAPFFIEVQLGPSVVIDEASNIDINDATIIFQNHTKYSKNNLGVLLTLPPIKTVVNKNPNCIKIEGGNKPGSNFLDLQSAILNVNQVCSVYVVFQNPTQFTSVEAWDQTYGYTQNNIMLIGPVIFGPERRN